MAISLRELANRVNSSVPVGTIVAFYGNSAPTSWLICDGRSCSGTELSRVMGISNVPDLRGRFIRMIGGNADRMAVAQGDAIRNITGSIRGFGSSTGSQASFTGAFRGDHIGGNGNGGYPDPYYNTTFDASRVVPTASENRPVNMAFNFIIKVENS